jgi:curved DNA-binding protein CbpA
MLGDRPPRNEDGHLNPPDGWDDANDPYKRLGVERGADAVTIKKAFRMLSKNWHPDRVQGQGSEEEKLLAEKIFKSFSEAYNLLSNPEKKAAFDAGTIDINENPISSERASSGSSGENPQGNFNFGNQSGADWEDILREMYRRQQEASGGAAEPPPGSPPPPPPPGRDSETPPPPPEPEQGPGVRFQESLQNYLSVFEKRLFYLEEENVVRAYPEARREVQQATFAYAQALKDYLFATGVMDGDNLVADSIWNSVYLEHIAVPAAMALHRVIMQLSKDKDRMFPLSREEAREWVKRFAVGSEAQRFNPDPRVQDDTEEFVAILFETEKIIGRKWTFQSKLSAETNEPPLRFQAQHDSLLVTDFLGRESDNHARGRSKRQGHQKSMEVSNRYLDGIEDLLRKPKGESRSSRNLYRPFRREEPQTGPGTPPPPPPPPGNEEEEMEVSNFPSLSNVLLNPPTPVGALEKMGGEDPAALQAASIRARLTGGARQKDNGAGEEGNLSRPPQESAESVGPEGKRTYEELGAALRETYEGLAKVTSSGLFGRNSHSDVLQSEYEESLKRYGEWFDRFFEREPTPTPPQKLEEVLYKWLQIAVGPVSSSSSVPINLMKTIQKDMLGHFNILWLAGSHLPEHAVDMIRGFEQALPSALKTASELHRDMRDDISKLLQKAEHVKAKKFRKL